MDLGIMQGRLSASESGTLQEFPRGQWEDEFARAAAAGLKSIEWLYDVHGEEVNPLASDEGLARMRELGRRHGIAVESLCAHYLVEQPGELLRRLDWLLARCRLAGIRRVVLPFLESAEDQIGRLPPRREGVELLVETTLQAEPLRQLVDGLDHGVNYDSGNAAALGRNAGEELEILGSRVRGVHLKDRSRDGENMPLGEGIVDFRALFLALERIGYAGPFVLETPRPRPGDEISGARRSVEFVSTIPRR